MSARLVLSIGLFVAFLPSALAKGKAGNGFPCKWNSDCESGDCYLRSHTCKGSGSGASSKLAAGAPCKWSSDCASGNCSLSSHTCKGGAPSGGSGSGDRGSSGGGDTSSSGGGRPATVELPPVPPPTECTRDLMATVYKDHAGEDTYERYAHENCREGSDADREAGKKLFAAGYGKNFSRILGAIKGRTPKQIECAQAEFDRLPPEDKKYREIQVSGLCDKATAVVDCVSEVRAAVYPTEKDRSGLKSSAQKDCEAFTPEVVTQSLVLFKAGYGLNFPRILEIVKKATPEQLECAKHQFDLYTAQEKTVNDLRIDKLCKSPGPNTDCYFDLLKTVYTDYQKNRRRSDTAVADCRDYSAEQIADAKKFTEAGWKPGSFSDILRVINKSTPSQVKCRLAHIPKATASEKSDPSFTLPVGCK